MFGEFLMKKLTKKIKINLMYRKNIKSINSMKKIYNLHQFLGLEEALEMSHLPEAHRQ